MRAMSVMWMVGLLVACGGGDGGEEATETLDFPFACDTVDATDAEAGLCRIYADDGTEFSADDVSDECGYLGGTVVDDCPDGDEVGTCETDQGSGVLVEYVYYAPTFTVDTAREHCETRNSCVFSCEFVAAR